MSEGLASLYKPLLAVHVLHHYWLDLGDTVFDLISDSKLKNNRLLAYDRQGLLSLRPTRSTYQVLRALNAVFKDTALGFSVLIPQSSRVSPDTGLEFIITVTNAAFFNYTALTLQPQKIVELYNPPEDTVYRYKSNVFVADNRTGTSRGSGSNKTLYLSTEYKNQGPTDKIESLVRSGTALSQLTGDPPAASLQELNSSADNMPVFVQQHDVPDIIPPAGLMGAPDRGIRLSDEYPDQIFMLIRLYPRRSDDEDFSFSDADGAAKTPHPVFQIRFKNRSTFRHYLNQQTRETVSVENQTLPLTHFGNAGSGHKPPIDLIKTERSGASITRLISEIFV